MYIKYLDDLIISLRIQISSKYPKPDVVLIFQDKEFRPVATCLNQGMDYGYDNDGDYRELTITIPRFNLSKGKYALTLNLLASRGYKPLISHQGILEFSVDRENPQMGRPFCLIPNGRVRD